MAHGNQDHGHTVGDRATATYSAWLNMKARCKYASLPCHKNYSGRGIAVCERWSVFANFLSDMGERPGPEYTLDRIDNDLGYGPDNCRWATRTEQARNRRITSMTTFDGVSMPISELSEITGMDWCVLYRRIVTWGWSAERAVLEEDMRLKPRSGTVGSRECDLEECSKQLQSNRGNSKLTPAQVMEIRSMVGFTQAQIAAQYGISQTQVSKIRRGDSWPARRNTRLGERMGG